VAGMTNSHSRSKRRFEATARREGRWWIVSVDELQAVTQARSVREIDDMATGLVSALLDLEPDDIEVHVEVQLPREVAEAWREAGRLREQADEASRQAAELSRRAVRSLVSEQRVTQVDAAALLGISQQRVHQLAH